MKHENGKIFIGVDELAELPHPFSIEDLRDDDFSYIKQPEEISIDFEMKSATDVRKALMVDCFGKIPYRKEGCSKCQNANSCVKAKIASDFNAKTKICF